MVEWCPYCHVEVVHGGVLWSRLAGVVPAVTPAELQTGSFTTSVSPSRSVHL